MPVQRSKRSQTASRNSKKSRPAKSRSKRLDDQVEESLHQRATGYSKIKTIVKVIEGKPVMFKHHEPVLADVNAAKFWLANRQPKRWKQPKPTQIESAAEDDPFLVFLKSINGNVMRPVEYPPRNDLALESKSEGPTRPAYDDGAVSSPDSTDE